MKHVLFAEFADSAAAEDAVRDLADQGIRESRCQIELHSASGQGETERPLNQTDVRSALLLGLGLAALVGGAMGWLVTGPLGLFPVGTWTGVMTGFIMGLAFGLLGGAISGAMNPNRQIDTMERHAGPRGGVVATIEVAGEHEQESVERVFREHGALVERRVL